MYIQRYNIIICLQAFLFIFPERFKPQNKPFRIRSLRPASPIFSTIRIKSRLCVLEGVVPVIELQGLEKSSSHNIS